MSIYHQLYCSIVSRGRQRKNDYGPGSGLHAHHIVPKFMGGSDDEKNLTYLTVREHRIAHFLLWKQDRAPNNLRAMSLLGANLTTEQRRVVGEYCRDNKIGLHNPLWDDVRVDWQQRGRDSQDPADKKSFMYWASNEGRSHRASLGGLASYASGNNKDFLFWASAEGRKLRASLGGKSHKGKIAMRLPGDKGYRRVKRNDVPEWIANGYVLCKPENHPEFLDL